MPELAEVEMARRLAEEISVGRRILEAVVSEDPIVYDKVPAQTFAEAITGRRVTAAERHGKYLWLVLDDGPSLLVHLGMTGALRAPDIETIHYRTGPTVAGEPWPPRFTKLVLRLDDGGELAYTNARRLGRLRLQDDPRAVPPVSRLGFDPYLALPPVAELGALIRRRRTSLKALLLDQKFSAGVGNWIADDVLYMAGLRPDRRGPTLSDAEVAALHDALGTVVRVAVEVDADSERFPKGWLFHLRWGKPEGVHTVDGDKVVFDTIAGRTTAWVPARQR